MIQHGARVVHHIPGRLRVRLPRSSRRPDILRDLHGFIRGLGGVREVEINPLTGSILVHYEPESAAEVESLLARGASSGWEAPPELTDVDELADRIEREADFLAAHSELALHIVHAVKALNSAVREASGNTVDLKVLLPAGLAVWAFWKHGAEASTPMWVTLAIFAINSFLTLHRPTSVHISRHVTRIEQSA
jgi:hypothetical protein